MSTFKTAKGTELPLLKLKGKDYLQVMHRLVWFREERPNWSIETTLLERTDKFTLARAVIRDEQMRIIATSHKTETIQGFEDHSEKAETGAIGRALALCGYGTQFTDELDEGERIVDSPVHRPSGMPIIRPEAPPEGHGFQDDEYKIPFGQWKMRTFDNVYEQFGEQRLADYLTFLEESAKKKGKPLTDDVADFIKRAEHFLGTKERQWAAEAGARG